MKVFDWAVTIRLPTDFYFLKIICPPPKWCKTHNLKRNLNQNITLKFRKLKKKLIKSGPIKCVTSISKAKAAMVRGEPTTTRTAGIDTSPWLGSMCHWCHELRVIFGQKWIQFEEVRMGHVLGSRQISFCEWRSAGGTIVTNFSSPWGF